MVVRHIDHFDPITIMESGQCFRMAALGPGACLALAGDRQVAVEDVGDGNFAFSCDQDQFDGFWARYFDLDTDYGRVFATIDPKDGFLLRAAQFARGLRILRQEPWEALISFILSTRKNIPAIRDCVARLCAGYGRDIGQGLFAFPTPRALAGADEMGLRACGLGYRAPYVKATACLVAGGRIDLRALNALDDDALRQALMALPGVGVKVANCAMLFGYHRLAASPVDVWIQRVIDEQYGGVSPFAGFGPYAGILQQAMFMYARAKAF